MTDCLWMNVVCVFEMRQQCCEQCCWCSLDSTGQWQSALTRTVCIVSSSALAASAVWTVLAECGYVAGVQVWWWHSGPAVGDQAASSVDRPGYRCNSQVCWWPKTAATASWAGGWCGCGFGGDVTDGRSSCWWHVWHVDRMSAGHLWTHRGHARQSTAWWCHFQRTRWDRRQRAAVNDHKCAARWLATFHPSSAVNTTHTSPWWQQCTTPPPSWLHLLQRLDQMQTQMIWGPIYKMSYDLS